MASNRITSSCLLLKNVLKCRRRTLLMTSLIIISLTCSLILVHSLQRPSKTSQKSFQNKRREEKKTFKNHVTDTKPRDEHVLDYRVVHIDLKGAPPSLAYLEQLFPLLSSLGANAILLEYEDMFPFKASLQPIRAQNAFSEQTVRRLQHVARANKLDVIPLVQTFGHLEFALKLEEFRSLREVPDLPQALCPSRNASLAFIREMVDQVLSLHPNSRFLHIGCDEVYHLALCEECRLKDRDRLFLDHVRHVAEHVVKRHPGVVPIIWDDMLRQISFEAIKESRIGHLGVEPMIWTYVRDIYRFIPEPQFLQYSQLFAHVWTASAFKGAFGETLNLPNVKMHLENNIAWTQVMKEQTRDNHVLFRGLVLTGWSRYDHLATLCELLPAAIPSLALALISVTSGQFAPKHVFQEFDRVLSCPLNEEHFGADADHALEAIESRDPNLLLRAQECRFAGFEVFQLMKKFKEVSEQLEQYLYDVTQHKAWLTDYNVRHNISSPFRVDEALQEFQTNQYSLQSLLRSAKDSLSRVYDKFTVYEWIEQRIYPFLIRMERLWNQSLALKGAKVWPKRPLPLLDDLKRFIHD